MPTPPNIYDHIAQYGTRDQLIRSFLALPTWTPAMGALLVSGITPPEGCTTIPNGGISLDNQPLNMATVQFAEARKILNQWNDWIEDVGDTGTISHDSVTPYEFFIWCDQEEIENDWLRLLRHLAGCPVDGYVARLPSPVELFASFAVSPPPKQSTGGPPRSSQVDTPQPQSVPDTIETKIGTASLLSQFTENQPLQGKKSSLPTSEIAAAFDGIAGWDKETWEKRLSDTKWVTPARTAKGAPGRGKSAMWDPVHLATLTIVNRHPLPETFTKAFKEVIALAPWLEQWKAYIQHDAWYS